MNKRLKKKIARKKNFFYNKRGKPKKRILKYNQWLVNRYPFLDPRNANYDFEGYFYERTLYDLIPDGWRKAFGISFMEELRNDLIKHDYLYDFEILQIKEKYGGLRFYCGSAPRSTFNIIHKYEDISFDKCIRCGTNANIILYYDWYIPLCDTCKIDMDNERRTKLKRLWKKGR